MVIERFSLPPAGRGKGGRVRAAAAVALAAALLSACAVGPDYQTPGLFSPATWFGKPQPKLASLPTNEPVDPEWWTIFHDPILTGLMRRVAASNLDVRISAIRLAESRAQRRVTGADQFPSINGNASYTREKVSNRGVIGIFGGGSGTTGGTTGSTGNNTGGSGSGSGATTPASADNGSGLGINSSSNGLGGTFGAFPSTGGNIPSFNLFQGGFDASWELDLWGRVRREVESADATLQANTEARRQQLVTSLAELARDYVQLRGTQETLRITRENLQSASESARLSDERFRGGLATDLDVANARAQVEVTAAQIPQLLQNQDQTVNAIALLLGEPPGALSAELTPPKPVPPIPPQVPVGLPTQLVERRPDVRQAEAQLHAATADIGEAQAEFFPKITLSGSFALQAVRLKDFANLGSRTFGLGPSVTVPLFEGGRLRGTLELRKAEQQEAAIKFQQTVLSAFHDVDNALIAYRAEQQRHDRLVNQVTEARRALNLSQQRFRQGVSDFLEVLTAERTAFSADQQLADSTQTMSTNLIQLYKALGGGWEPFYAEAEK